MKLLSRVRLLVTPWTAPYQAPPTMGFSRQEYWSGVPFVPWKNLFPQSCVSFDSFIEGLCLTQVYIIQSPCPHSSPLMTCPSSGDIQIQFRLNLCGVSGSWCTRGIFEPSEHLWRVWGLILNVILPLLPSCSGFSFAFIHVVSPQSHSSTMQPPKSA